MDKLIITLPPVNTELSGQGEEKQTEQTYLVSSLLGLKVRPNLHNLLKNMRKGKQYNNIMRLELRRNTEKK